MTVWEAYAHRAPLTWSSRRLALLVGVVGTLGILLLDAVVRDEPTPKGDDQIYERMAADPFGRHTYVFAFRIAIPWLVHVLPFSHTFSFSVLAWICSGAAGGVLFLLLERLGISRPLAIALGLVLALSPPLLVASLRQGRNPDPMTVLVMVTGTLFIVERRSRALAATVLVGALNRESALFLPPLAYAMWAHGWWDREALGRAVAVAVPGAAAFLALRFFIPTVSGYGGAGHVWSVFKDSLGQPFVEGRRVASVFGPLWLVAPLALPDSAFARRGLVLVPLCLAGLFFAQDWGRVVFVATPVVYGSAALALQRRPRLIAPTLVLCVALIVGYAAYMQVSGTANIISASPPPYPVR